MSRWLHVLTLGSDLPVSRLAASSVAADVLPAYAPHRRYFSDIRSEGLHALLRDDDARCQRVAEAQKTLVPRYTPAVVGREWLAMLSGFAPAQRTAIRM